MRRNASGPLSRNRIPPGVRDERSDETRDEKSGEQFFPKHHPIHYERVGHRAPFLPFSHAHAHAACSCDRARCGNNLNRHLFSPHAGASHPEHFSA